MASSVSLVADGRLRGKVRVPPSKSYTHRAVITASLSSGTSKVYNPLVSRDTVATFGACRAMGAELVEEENCLVVEGSEPHMAEDEVNVENSGTTLRFMTCVFALPQRGQTVLTGDVSIRRRPMQGLLDALSGLGAKARSSRGNGCAPIIVGEGGIDGGNIEIRGDVSSQFVSSILLCAPMARGDTSLDVVGLVSRPYIDATLRLSELHGVEVTREGDARFGMQGRQEYEAADFAVPGDFGSAAFVMAAVAAIGGRVELSDMTTALPQADSAIVDILGRLGVEVEIHPDSVIVESDGESLAGGEFNLADSPDLLPVLSVLSLRCDGPVEIRGVAHARFKESDRIRVAVEGLRMMGAKVEERKDGMKIVKPKALSHSVVDAHDDHRMFMAFSLATLLAPEAVRVIGAESVDVSYPTFFADMESLGVKVVRR